MRRLLAGLALLMVAATTANAQVLRGTIPVSPGSGAAPGMDGIGIADEGGAARGGKKVTPMLAPVPLKNSQLGWGLILMGGLIHRFDADTSLKPSTAMVGGFYTENNSWGVMAIEAARFGHDAWRARAGVAHMDINYDFYGIGEAAGEAGRSVELNQTMNFALGSFLRRVTRGLYLGAGVLWMKTEVGLRDSLALPVPPPIPLPAANSRSVELVAPNLQAELDTRDDDYYPSHGMYGQLKGSFFTKSLGSARTFQRYNAFWSVFRTLKPERVVVGANLIVCSANGDAPFWALCSVGAGRGALRGYQQGRYRDTVMTTGQAELRLHSAGRFGSAVFAGFGMVAPSIGDFGHAKVLPAGGLGLRYQLTREYPMHLRLDYAWGRDGGLLYFGVSEAF